MSDNRLVKLGNLLESKNKTIRNEAAAVIGQIPLTNVHLLPMLKKFLQNTQWDTRVSTSEALGKVLASTSTGTFKFDISDCGDKIENLNIHHVIQYYRSLLCSEGDEMNTKGYKVSKQEQRTLIDRHLDMESKIFGSTAFLKDNEIDPSLYQPASADTSLERIELEKDVELLDNETEEEIDQTFRKLLGWIVGDIADQKWQTRHGGFLALHKVLIHSFQRLSPKWIEVISQRIIEVLALDRFVDFATGSNSVAPVREIAAQCICVLICKLPSNSRLVNSIIYHLKQLLQIDDEKRWQCRQTSLITLKYYFAAVEPDEKFYELVQIVLERMNDQNDEVVSAAIVASASLFSNQKISSEKRRDLVNLVMKSVWEKLKQPECLKQLRDGVDSVLTDLIGIVNFYIQVESDSNLLDTEFIIFVDLLDPRLSSRTRKVLDCIGLSLSKSINLSDNTLYQLLKMLYRCCLLTPNDNNHLLDNLLMILLKVVEIFSNRFGSLELLHNSIGFWIGCLFCDDKKAEIDVFSLCVDGPTSSKDNPIAYMCGAEIASAQENERSRIILERKIVLARFLSPIIDALYRSGKVIRDQPVHISIQLIFLPYLKSTVLSQRLGAALMLNCWARMFRRQAIRTDLTTPLIFPELVVMESMNALNSSPDVFNDVLSSIQNLRQECDDFTKYCRRNGAKESDMPDGSQINELETFTEDAYKACMKYCKEQNKPMVKQRFDYITTLIKSTKATIRINANRVNALLGSALFYFNYTPQRLTPMIRPLMECSENEDQIKMAEEILYDSIPLMLVVSSTRDPCPHAKIIKQICTSLISSESYCPSVKKWESKEELTIISSLDMEHDENYSRSKNSEMILIACFNHLGLELLNICKELNNYLILKVENEKNIEGLEKLMLNVEVVRIIFLKWKMIPNEDECHNLAKLLKNRNSAIRYRISRLILEFAKVDLIQTMNLFYRHFENFINDINDDYGRAGIVEVLYLLSNLEDKLVGSTSLLAPLAFSAISDKLEIIRETAASAFRKMVTILPIENNKFKVISNYNEYLTEKYQNNLNFLNVLSCPGNLPHLTKFDIPMLRNDVELRGYQLEGITWMMFLNKFGLNGILADDMGLGKTIQTLCLLSIVNLNDDKEINFSLIVCPKTLCNHWCNEWLKYFPEQKPLRRIDDINKNEEYFAPIVVASYDELRHQQFLRKKRWKYIILDEGHCIRNHTTQLFEVVSNLISKHRLILSGTPVQNSPADLWALFRFLMPGYLSTRSSFHQKYIKPMLICRNPKATDQQTREGEEALNLLHRQILPFLLRRVKSDVLNELPEKVVQDCLCQLTDIQKKIYSAVVDKCTLMREKKDEEDGSFSLSALHTLISLRKLVDHPILIAEMLGKLNLQDGYDVSNRENRNYELSGKLVALKEILEECQIGKDKTMDSIDNSIESGVEVVPSISSHRALIFCQWRASVDLIANYLDNGDFGTGITYLRLDGTVPPSDRQTVVDQFNQDESIDLMLLTTHIGGVGLNLTGADVVIFLDHDWNPVKDLQAIDRAHRLGQKRTVNVYRLITQGSIEEKIMKYQKFKSDTANVLVGADNRSLGSMATDELLELFTLDDGDGKIKKSESGNDAPKTKKRKTVQSSVPGVPTDKWSVEELWDNSQYEEQHSITQFLKDL